MVMQVTLPPAQTAKVKGLLSMCLSGTGAPLFVHVAFNSW